MVRECSEAGAFNDGEGEGGERKRRMERGETHRRAPVITQDGRQTSADFNNDRCTAGGLRG